MDEVGVQNELVVIDPLTRQDETEGLDEALTGIETADSRLAANVLAPAYIEVTGETLQMLALVRTVGQNVVECLGAITGGDDDWELQLFTKRLHGVDAKTAEVVHSLIGRRVVDTALLGSRALGELHQSEVRCEKHVLHTRYILNETLSELTLGLRPSLTYPGCSSELITMAKLQWGRG